MNPNLRKIACKQLMAQLLPLQQFKIPKLGWVQTIRKALGMTNQQLAHKCNVSKQRILRIEKDEVVGRTTIATLEKVAQELGCSFVYGFVPKKDLNLIIEEQAHKKALEVLSRVSHSMTIEEQKVEELMQKQQLELLKEQFMKQNTKSLWD
jgi:predicted DNA-binding mobile mystery protein A